MTGLKPNFDEDVVRGRMLANMTGLPKGFVPGGRPPDFSHGTEPHERAGHLVSPDLHRENDARHGLDAIRHEGF